MITRRGLIRSLIAAPAIVVVGNIMPVKALILPRSTVTVAEEAGDWVVQHRWSKLTLGPIFKSYEEAAAACREIDKSFDLDKIAIEVARKGNFEADRDAIYAIQRKHGGYGRWPHGRPSDAHAEYLRARLTQQQRVDQSAGQGT